MKKNVYVLGGLMLTACASTPELPEKKLSPKFATSTPIYGYLEKLNEEYYFSKFSLVKKNELEPWVQLNNLTPAFSTREVNNCSTDGLVIDGENTGLCDSNSSLFRSSLLTTGDVLESTVGNTFAVAFTFGLGTSVVQGHYSTKFDASEFNQAVENASQKLDREKLFNEVANYEQRRIDETNLLKQKAATKKESIKQHLELKSQDKSGLFNKRIKQDYVKVDLINQPALPNVQNSWVNTTELQTKLDKLLEKAEQNIQYKLNCKRVSGWNIDISGCDKQWNNDNKISQYTVQYSINSQNYRRLKFTPEYQDNSVRTYVAKDGITLMIENKTERFLLLDAASMYVDRDIVTKRDLNIELPPLAFTKIVRLDKFENYKEALTIKNATSVILNKKAQLGLALKYKVVELDKDQTLFKRQNVNLLKLAERL